MQKPNINQTHFQITLSLHHLSSPPPPLPPTHQTHFHHWPNHHNNSTNLQRNPGNCGPPSEKPSHHHAKPPQHRLTTTTIITVPTAMPPPFQPPKPTPTTLDETHADNHQEKLTLIRTYATHGKPTTQHRSPHHTQTPISTPNPKCWSPRHHIGLQRERVEK